MNDLVIRGATVVDGLGNAPGPDRRRGSRRAHQRRRRRPGEGDARDRRGRAHPRPGHRRSAHPLRRPDHLGPDASSPSPSLGVTTTVMGNCGFGIAPAAPEARDLILRNLSVVEGMDLDAWRAGVRWDFETLRRVHGDASRHRSVRERRGARRPLRDPHRGDGRGGVRASQADRGRACPDAGAGGRGDGRRGDRVRGVVLAQPLGLRRGAHALDHHRAVRIRRAGRRYGHAPGRNRAARLRREERGGARRGRGAPWPRHLQGHRCRHVQRAGARTMHRDVRGVRVGAGARQSRVHPRSRASRSRSTSPWPTPIRSSATTGSRRSRRTRPSGSCRSSGTRSSARRFRTSLATPRPGLIFQGNWERVVVAVPALAKNEPLANRNIAEIAAERDADPLDVMLDLGLEENLETTFIGQFLNVGDEGVAKLLGHDAGRRRALRRRRAPHLHVRGGLRPALPRPLGARARRVRPRRRRAPSHEPSRRSLRHPRSRPHRTRGLGRDLLLFDPDTVGITPAERVSDLPGGGRRTIRRSIGVHGVFCNGVEVFDGTDYVTNGRGAGARPGSLRAVERVPPCGRGGRFALIRGACPSAPARPAAVDRRRRGRSMSLPEGCAASRSHGAAPRFRPTD